jgi:mono/diheme cytochrome c family protein
MIVTGHCNNCHTPAYAGKHGNVPEKEWLVGNPIGHRGPWGTTYATNLRLSVRNFTEDEWIAYAKTAKPRPPMPWWSVQATSTQDLRAMYAYIKQLGPAGEPAKAFLPPGQEPSPPYVQWPADAR